MIWWLLLKSPKICCKKILFLSILVLFSQFIYPVLSCFEGRNQSLKMGGAQTSETTVWSTLLSVSTGLVMLLLTDQCVTNALAFKNHMNVMQQESHWKDNLKPPHSIIMSRLMDVLLSFCFCNIIKYHPVIPVFILSNHHIVTDIFCCFSSRNLRLRQVLHGLN